LFERRLNAGDLDAVSALYAPEALFVPKLGEPIVGRYAIRCVLSKRIGGAARLHGRIINAVTAGDIAVLYPDWQGTVAGKEEHSRAVEVLRREPDGSWKLVFGDPNGRG
jgi:ketosteroid isomerase-like protein